MLEKEGLILEVKRLDYTSKKDGREVKGISITYGTLSEPNDNHLGYDVDSAFMGDMSLFDKLKGRKLPLQAKLKFEVKSTKYAPRLTDIVF